MALFRSSRNAAPKPCCCFGKIPSYGDFVSVGTDFDEARALTSWIEHGVACAADVRTLDPGQRLRFAWTPPGARRVLVGVLWPSADSAGRRFPLALFGAWPRAQLADTGPRRPIAAERAWAAFESLHARLAAAPSLDALRALVRDTDVPDPPGGPDVNREYVARVAPTGADVFETVPLGLHLADLVHFAESLRGAGGLPEFALRMRLHSTMDAIAESVTWLHVLTENLGVPDLDAALFVRTDGAAAGELVVVHRDLQPADLASLLSSPGGGRGVDEIGYRGAAGSSQDEAYLASFEHKWRHGTNSLASLLEIGAQGWTPGPLPEGDDVPAAHSSLEPLDEPPPTAAIGGPAMENDTAPAGVDEDEITGEIEMPPATDPITGPIGSVDTVDAETVAGAALPEELRHALDETAEAENVEDLERRVRDLAARPLLPGRLVRVALPGDSERGEMLVYIDDDGAAASSPGATAALDEVRRRIAGHDEARALLARIEHAHRALEGDLERLVEAACARTRRPGAGSASEARGAVSVEGR